MPIRRIYNIIKANPFKRLKDRYRNLKEIEGFRKKTKMIYEIATIFYKSFIGQHPVVIYQMGKVGSSTIYSTIKQLSRNPVFQVHFLRKAEVERIQKKYETAGLKEEYMHVTHSKIISNFVNKKYGLRWHIITVVRDPLVVKLSYLFHNPRLHKKFLFDENGVIDPNKALSIASQMINDLNPETDYVYNWIDNEFKNYLAIDVFDYPFDKKKGYEIINHDGNTILIIQTEAINNNLIQAIKEMNLTTVKNIEIKISNENFNKEFSEIYSFVKNNLRLSPQKAREIYENKYVRHFYTDEFIADKINFWSNRN